jgi:predicted O-methyltransferase YrrM
MRGRSRLSVRPRLPLLVRQSSVSDLTRRLGRMEKELRGLRKQIGAPGIAPEIEDPEFLALANEVVAAKRTMLRQDRLWILWQAARNTARIDGDVAEIGTYRGGSAAFIAGALARAGAKEKAFHVIDTFAGHPPGKLSEHDADAHKRDDKFKNTSAADVQEYLRDHPGVVVHEGEFAAVAPELPDAAYSFVHVDVDIYEPAAECLRYFAPRLARGGVIVLDDYGAPTCPGIRRAADELLDAGSEFQGWHGHTEQLVLVKTG